MRVRLKPSSEQAALKLSILVTVLTGLAGVAAGLTTGSRDILFDGMYSFIAAMLTFGALTVSKLLMQEPTRKFQFGYWHLEPLMGAVESAILVTVCVYAVVDGTAGIGERWADRLVWDRRHLGRHDVYFRNGHGNSCRGSRPSLE